MILVDANLLLYAFDAGSEHHHPARQWLESAIDSSTPIGLPWVCLMAFVRITTHPRNRQPLPLGAALQVMDDLIALPSVIVVGPGALHWRLFRDAMTAANAKGDLVTDAHLAALAIEHNATLCTNDADFSRFPGLRVEFPLRS